MAEDKGLVQGIKKVQKTYTISTIQGTIGDMELDNLGRLPKEEQVEFWRKHEIYIEELKRTGEYMKPKDIELTINAHPIFDKIEAIGKTESYSFTILNFGGNGVKRIKS